MNNSFVLLFSGDSHWWWVTDLEERDYGLRGFVRDGCFWMDYHTEANTIHICVAKVQGTIDWIEPINILKNKVLLETRPVTIDSTDYLTIQRWAKDQYRLTNS